MAKQYCFIIRVLAFLISASFVKAEQLKNSAATTEHLKNITRRNCLELLDANGQQVVDDDGEPQFSCDNYFPTTDMIQARIASTGLVQDPTKIPTYYTGWPLNEVEGELGGWIEEWMEAYLARQPSSQPEVTGYYWWWTAVPRDWWYAQSTWFSKHQGDGPDFIFPSKMSNTFDACISESLATLNVGKEIFLFVPSDYVLGSEVNRQWWSIEYPLLTSNPSVEYIYRIDPRPAPDGSVCGERVIWVKGFKTQPQSWFCDQTPRPLPPPPPRPAPPQVPSSRSVVWTDSNNTDHGKLLRRECWPEEDLEGNWEYAADQCDDYLPTLSQCQANLKQNNRIDDREFVPVYYTGWPDGIAFDQITTWVASYMAFYVENRGDKPKGWYWFWSVLNLDWHQVQGDYIDENFASLKNINLPPAEVNEESAKEVITICLCEAFAISCVAPTVVLMVPYDYVLGSEAGRHWWTIEFGALTKNPNVRRIYRIDPSPESTLESPETMCHDEGRWIPKLIWTRGIDPEAPQVLSCSQFVTTTEAPTHPVVPPPAAEPPPPPPPALNFERDAPQVVQNSTNSTHFNHLSRRECVGTTDVMTGELQYLPENCDNMAPTITECLGHWNQKSDDGVVIITDPKKLPIYYTGWPADTDSEDLFRWFATFANNYIKVKKDPTETSWYWFWNTWDKDWYDVQEAYLEANADKIQNIKPKGKGQEMAALLDGCMNEAFAKSCIYPKVFLMVPQDYVLGSEKHRHWWAIEFGALTRNPNVQEIFRVDPRPHETDEDCSGYAPVLIWSREAHDEEHPMDFICDVFISETPVVESDSLEGPLEGRGGTQVDKREVNVSGSSESYEASVILSERGTVVENEKGLRGGNERSLKGFQTSTRMSQRASVMNGVESGTILERAEVWS